MTEVCDQSTSTIPSKSFTCCLFESWYRALCSKSCPSCRFHSPIKLHNDGWRHSLHVSLAVQCNPSLGLIKITNLNQVIKTCLRRLEKRFTTPKSRLIRSERYLNQAHPSCHERSLSNFSQYCPKTVGDVAGRVSRHCPESSVSPTTHGHQLNLSHSYSRYWHISASSYEQVVWEDDGLFSRILRQ